MKIPVAVCADGTRGGIGSRCGGRWGGLGLNLLLSLLYLTVAPLTEVPNRDWAILVGSYFATFLLADTATTNALGGDAGRVGGQLFAGTPLLRILVTKNLGLLATVGVPVLAVTAVITLQQEPVSRLALTLPAVLGPVLAWLGIGNVASVLLPTSPVPLGVRWQQRRHLRSTARWLATVALPWALCFVVDPLTQLPTLVFHAVGLSLDSSLAMPATVLLVCGLGTYGALTAAALRLPRHRDLRLRDLVDPTGVLARPGPALTA